MKLTENDIRDINACLQARKPLPDKYRFMLFSDREVELIWEGKSSEITNTVLPFQTIEVIDEPRDEKTNTLLNPKVNDWNNKLIWGDNNLILSSLRNGPLREEIENQGGVKLIYIDPPFDVGADFSVDIEVGERLERERERELN